MLNQISGCPTMYEPIQPVILLILLFPARLARFPATPATCAPRLKPSRWSLERSYFTSSCMWMDTQMRHVCVVCLRRWHWFSDKSKAQIKKQGAFDHWKLWNGHNTKIYFQRYEHIGLMLFYTKYRKCNWPCYMGHSGPVGRFYFENLHLFTILNQCVYGVHS